MEIPNLDYYRIPKSAIIISTPNVYYAIVDGVKHLVIMYGHHQQSQQRELEKRANSRLKSLPVGTKVRLKRDVVARHSKTVPPHAGFTKEQFTWRDSLNQLLGQEGEIETVFEKSKHRNVKFGNHCIGIDCTELEEVL